MPIFEGTNSIILCTSYKSVENGNCSCIILMCHNMKIWKKTIEKRIRTTISKNQFEFMPGRFIIAVIFCKRQTIQVEKKLCMIVIYLEKAYDRVSREMLWCRMNV